MLVKDARSNSWCFFQTTVPLMVSSIWNHVPLVCEELTISSRKSRGLEYACYYSWRSDYVLLASASSNVVCTYVLHIVEVRIVEEELS